MTRYWFVNVRDLIEPENVHGPFDTEQGALNEGVDLCAKGELSLENDLPCILTTYEDGRAPVLKAISRHEIAAEKLDPG